MGEIQFNFRNHILLLLLLLLLLLSGLQIKGAQWLSGRVLDSRPKGPGFEPHRRHCVVVFSKTQLS